MTVSWAMRVVRSWSRARGSSGRWCWIPAVAAAAVVLAGSGVAAAGIPAAAAGARWGRAVEVPGLAALNAGGNAQVLSVSCWRAGDCRAGGFYTRRLGYREAFVVSERNGRWGKLAELPGSAALNVGGNARVLSVSCVPGGDCVAGGFYTDRGRDTEGFVVSERGGRWGTAREVPGLAAFNASGGDAQVSSVSCASGGYCAAGGFFDGVVVCQACGGGPFVQNSQGFVVTERAGRWGTAQVPPGLTGLNTGQHAAITSVSCPSAGNCAAGGFYQTNVMDGDDAFPVEAFVVDHAKGRWGMAEEVPGSAALNGGWDASVLSVSCSSAGDCSAGGYIQPVEDIGCDIATARSVSGTPIGPAQPSLNCSGSFVVTAKNGRWGQAQYVRNPGMSQVSSVSCSSAGDCSAGGFSEYTEVQMQAWVVTEQGGRWGTPEQVPGIERLLQAAGADRSEITSVSCWSPGNCGAGGDYWSDFNGHGQVFVVSERNGWWGMAKEVPGTATLNLGKIALTQVTSVSCTRPATCAAGGYYTDRSGHTQAFVGGEAP
jgi:hypothetical protein